MAYEEVAARGEKTFGLGGTYKDKKTGKKYYNPTEVEGYYLGSRQIDSKANPGKKDTLHTFQGEVRDRNGKTIFTGVSDIWGKTDLDRKISTAKVGLMTKASFTGMQPEEQVKAGKRQMYLFKVLQDKTNVLASEEFPEAGAPEEEPVDEAPADEAVSASGDEEAYEEEAALDAEDTPVDEPVAQPAKAPKAAKAPAPDRQAGVQALLNSKPKAAAKSA